MNLTLFVLSMASVICGLMTFPLIVPADHGSGIDALENIGVAQILAGIAIVLSPRVLVRIVLTTAYEWIVVIPICIFAGAMDMFVLSEYLRSHSSLISIWTPSVSVLHLLAMGYYLYLFRDYDSTLRHGGSVGRS